MQCTRNADDCANLARCYMERVDQLQARLRMEESRNEATFNKVVQTIAAEMEKPPNQRNYSRSAYEEVIALRRELETLSRICTNLDAESRRKLQDWLGE